MERSRAASGDMVAGSEVGCKRPDSSTLPVRSHDRPKGNRLQTSWNSSDASSLCQKTELDGLAEISVLFADAFRIPIVSVAVISRGI